MLMLLEQSEHFRLFMLLSLEGRRALLLGLLNVLGWSPVGERVKDWVLDHIWSWVSPKKGTFELSIQLSHFSVNIIILGTYLKSV